MGRKKNFCITDTKQSAMACGVAHHRVAGPTTEWTVSSPRSSLSADSLLGTRRECGVCTSAQGPWRVQRPDLCSRDRVTYLSPERQTASWGLCTFSGEATRPQTQAPQGTGHPTSKRSQRAPPRPQRKDELRTNLLTTTFLQTLSWLPAEAGPEEAAAQQAFLRPPAH